MGRLISHNIMAALSKTRTICFQPKRLYSEIPKHIGVNTEYTTNLEIVMPESQKPLSTYQVMDCNGNILDNKQEPNLSKETVVNMLKTMMLLNTTDKILYESQRQGRISFYMTNYGEEASHIGSAAAFDPDDFIYGQYRETGVLLWRGYTLDNLMDQCYSNKDDPGKGRQMPVHYGSAELNFSTISSPLATQLPIAVGSAYAIKRSKKKNIVVAYFGEGAASEGDAHAATNFAATLNCPIMFFCRNNGYAISTPAFEQYAGDGIAARGIALGIPTIRVDGNDVFAVYNVCKQAREMIIKTNRPVLVEAMTYRIGHHSTSDDSSAYRAMDEVNAWENNNNPITRLSLYAEQKGWWSPDDTKAWLADSRKQVLAAFGRAEAKLKPNPLVMFTDVYKHVSPRLAGQMKATKAHIEKYPEAYPIKNHEPIADPK